MTEKNVDSEDLTFSDSLLDDWGGKLDEVVTGHYIAEQRYRRFHYLVGLPAIVCATVAGATLFSDIANPTVKMIIGGVGLFAATLSAIQTFYSFAEQAEAHKLARKRYGAVRRKIQMIRGVQRDKLLSYGAGSTEFAEELKNMLASLDRISEESPSIPYKIVLKLNHEIIDALSIATFGDEKRE